MYVCHAGIVSNSFHSRLKKRGRARALDLFNFDYKIEVYTPAPKRKYGCFTLPILYNNALIGHIDPKAHRKEGIFEVRALHLELGVIVDDALVAEVKSAVRAPPPNP